MGRLVIGRIVNGKIRQYDRVAVVHRDGSTEPAKVTVLYGYEGLKRVEVAEASAGDLVAVAGTDNVEIGETLADAENPVALPVMHIDEPTVSMLFSSNVSPFSGREGRFVTSTQLRDRLWKERRTNVGIRVEDPKDLYPAQLGVFLDPNNVAVQEAARAEGRPTTSDA